VTRLGSFVREDDRPARRAIQLTVDAAPVPEFVSQAVLRRLENRARGVGSSEALITSARNVSAEHGLRHGVAMLRLLFRVGSGDSSAVAPLLNKLQPDPSDEVMWDATTLMGYDTVSVRRDNQADLVDFFETEIRRGFATDGYSQVFEWLLSNGRVSNNSPMLHPLLETLVTSAVNERSRIEQSMQSFDRAEVFSVAAALNAGQHAVALSGPSLLAAAKRDDVFSRFGPMEFSSFAPLGEVLADLPATLKLQGRRGGHAYLTHTPTENQVVLVHLIESDERYVHGDGRYSRWYSPFDIVEHDLGSERFVGPADIDDYLDERFGNWRGSPFYYDQVLDAPNTTIDRSLDGLLYVYGNLRTTFETGRRHYADEWSAIMRDRFGIDYSNFVPRGIHRKVLATPVTVSDVGVRQIRLVVADFDRVDAGFVQWLDSQRAADVFLVAGVRGDRLDGAALERLALANSLDAIDSASLIESDEDLITPIPGFDVADTVVYGAEKDTTRR
jgi:hypothetical protein